MKCALCTETWKSPRRKSPEAQALASRLQETPPAPHKALNGLPNLVSESLTLTMQRTDSLHTGPRRAEFIFLFFSVSFWGARTKNPFKKTGSWKWYEETFEHYVQCLHYVQLPEHQLNEDLLAKAQAKTSTPHDTPPRPHRTLNRLPNLVAENLTLTMQRTGSLHTGPRRAGLPPRECPSSGGPR